MARVLVVDDEPKLGKFVAQMLELDGHEVVRESSGREALERLAGSRFEVVVTDLRMPDVDGLAVLKAARACRPPPEVPPALPPHGRSPMDEVRLPRFNPQSSIENRQFPGAGRLSPGTGLQSRSRMG